MKLRKNIRNAINCLMIGLVSFWQVVPAGAADFYWDTDGTDAGNLLDGTGLGGTGTWDTVATNWWPVPAGALTTWGNTSADRAIFSGPLAFPPTLSTVTVGSVTANSLVFQRSGYSLTGGDITLAGTNAGLNAEAGTTATIASQILGSSGLVKTGGGSVRLSNATNAYTGVTSIQGGSLVVSNPAALGGTGPVSITLANSTPLNQTQIGHVGGSLVLDGTAGSMNFSRDVNFEGRGIGDRGSAILSLGNNTLSGVLNSAVSPLPLAPGGTFRNSRINSVNGTLTIAGTLNVNNPGTVTNLGGVNTAGVNDFSFAGGTLAGAGSLEKTGAGILDLSSASSVSGFTGQVRVSGSSVGQQSSVRVTQLTTGGTSAFGAGTGASTLSAIDLNGGVLEFRSNTGLDFNSLATGKNVYLRGNNSVVYSGPAGNGDAVNGTTTLGAFRVAQGNTAIFRSRNGFGTTLQAWTQETSNGNTGITNEAGGTLLFTGDAWNNNDGNARNLTFAGNGNTRIAGNITASGTNKQVVKQGNGQLVLNGTGGTFTGATSVQAGSVRITDFRSINNNTQAINLGNSTTTAGALVIGGAGAGTGTAAGLTTSKPILFNTTTGQSAIYANQAGTNPVLLNGAITTVSTTGNYNFGGSNTADNSINVPLPLAGTGGFTKSGAGTWVLNAANLYAGPTTIQNGTLKLRGTAAASDVIPQAATNTIVFGAQAITQTAGGTLEFRGASGLATTETLGALTPTAGAATVRLLGNGAAANLTFTSLGATTGASSVNFDTTAAASGVVTLTGQVATTATNLPGTANFQGHLYINGANFATTTAAGVVQAPAYGGAGNFRDAGPALVAVVHNRLTAATASGAATISSLNTNNQTLTLSGNLVVSTGGILQSGGTASIVSDSATSRLIQGGAAGTNVVIRVNGASDVLNLGSATNPVNISSVTTAGLTKNGAGTLNIFGTNAQTGATTINEGTVRLSGANARLSAAAGTALAVRQGATLDLSTGVTSANAVVTTVDGAGTISGISGLTFTQNGGGTWSGVYSGAGFNVTKTGGNASWLGSSTYTGVTTIGGAAGTGLVTVDTLADGGAPSGIGASTNAASNLVFNGASAGIVYRGDIIDNALTFGSRSASTDRLFTLDAAATGATLSSTASNNNAIVWSNTGAIVNNTTANATLTLTGTSTGDNTLNPQLVDSSVGGGVILGVSKTGAGQWNLGNSTNTYTGITTVADGVLGLNNAGALPANSPLVLGATTTSGIIQTSGTFARNLTVAPPTPGVGTISWGGTTGGGGFAAHATPLTVTLDGGAGLTWGAGGFVGTGGVQSLLLNSTSSISNVTLTNNIDLGTAVRTVSVNDNNNTGADYADLTGVLSGVGGGLLKTGAGILRVGNLNTYSGTTSVEAGTLVVSSLGDSAAPGATSVGDSTAGNTDAGAVVLGNATTTGGALVYVGPGETSDRKIRLNGTTANNAIYADGSGPLILTNVAHDTVATGDKTLSLRGTNMGNNMITSALANNGAGVLSVTVDGGVSWILSGANTYTGATTAAGSLGLGTDTTVPGTLVNNNGNIFAHGGDRTLANAVTLSNNATNGWYGEYGITVNGVTNMAAGANNVSTANSIVAGKALTFNGGITANALTDNRNWTFEGSGETVLNGAFTSNTGNGVNLIKNGDGTLVLGTSGAGSNWNIGNNAVDVDRGTLKFSVDNAIPTTFASAPNQSTTASTAIAGTTITVPTTTGLQVGQRFSGTNVPAGSTIVSIDSATTFTTSKPPTTAIASATALTFSGSGGLTITPEVATFDTATVDLNGTTQTVNAFTATSDGTAIITNSSATAATFRVGANNTNATFGTGGTGTYSITQPAGTINLAKIGTGTANFTGTLGYTGTTTSNGGVLNINSLSNSTGAVGDGGAVNFKGGFVSPSNLTSVVTDNGGLVSFADGVGTPFSMLNSLSLSMTANSGLELDVGDSGTDTLTTLSAATVGNVTTLFIKDIDITGGNTYNLLVDANGGLGASGNYSLNLPGYLGSTLTVTPNLVQLTAGTLITSDVYWNNGTGQGGGVLTSAWNTVDPTTTNINFSNAVGGGTALQTSDNLPGKGQKVIFQADNLTGGLPLTTTLEQGFTINALEFRASTTAADTSRTISIAPGAVSSNSLTIKPSVATNGINVQTGAAGTVSISAPIVAGTDQTWTVADAPVELGGGATTSGSAIVTVTDTTGLRPGMTVLGTGIPGGSTIVSVDSATQVTLSANATAAGTGLNILAAQQLNLSGAISGAGDVTKDGPGKLVVSGANGTLTGSFTNAAGITQVNTLSSFGGLVGVPGSGTDISVTGGSFYYNNGTSGTFVNDITLNGGTLSAGSNNQTYSGGVNVAGASSVNLRDLSAASAGFTTTARNVTLSGLVSGAGGLTLDSVATLTAGNAETGTLTLNNAASTWNGQVDFTRGTVVTTNIANASNATPYVTYDGVINFNQFGRLINRNFGTVSQSRASAINFAAGAVGEFVADNLDGTVTSNYTFDQNGVVNLNAGSIARFGVDATSNLNLLGGLNLNGNASVSVEGGDATHLLTISGIAGTGNIALNDEAGAWAVTSTRIHINAASSFVGNSSLNEGTLILGNKDALNGTGTLTVTGASTLQASVDLSGANAVGNSVTLANNLTVAGANSLQVSGTFTGTSADASRTLTNSLTTPAALTLSGPVALGDGTNTAGRILTVAGAGSTTISGVVSNGNAFANGITKTGTGTLTLSNVNTYTGPTLLSSGAGVNNGVIVATANDALGTGAYTSIINTGAGTVGQLQLSGGITLGNSSFRTSGVGTDGTVSGIIRNVSGNNTISGTVNLTGGGGASTYRADAGSLTFSGTVGGDTAQVNRIINLVGAGDFNFTGVIQDSNDATASTVGINSATTGTTTLSGMNTYTLGTTVSAGTLAAGANDVIPNGSAVTVGGAGSATLSFGAFNDSIGNLTLGSAAGTAGSVSQVTTSTGVATLLGNVTTIATGNPTASALISGNVALDAGTRTFTVADSTGSTVDLDVSAAVSGNGDFVKAGLGTMSFTGGNANTYSGITTVNAGTLLLNKTAGVNAIVGDGVSSKSIADVVINGGLVRMDASNQLDDSVFIQINAGGTFNRNGKTDTLFNFVNNGGTYVSGRGGSWTVIDPVWAGGNTDILGTESYGVLDVSGGTNIIHGEEGFMAGAGSVTVGSGGLNFSGTSSPTITISSESVADGAAGTLILNGNVTSTVTSGTASIAAGNKLIDTGSNAPDPGAWTDSGSAGANLGTLNLGAATRNFDISNGTADVDMSVSTVIINGGIDKLGAGSLLLTGANTYTGTTDVSAGALINNGSIANSTTTVDAGATLSGTGTFGGATTISGTHTVGTDSNGTGVATTSFTNGLTYSTGSTFVWDLVGDSTAPGTFDTVNATGGALTIGSGVNTTLRLGASDFSQAFWSNDQTWLVFSGASGGSGFFDGPVTPDYTGSINGPLVGTWSWSRTGNDVFLNFTAVPEPASLGGALVLLGSWFARRRNKRKNVNA